MSRVNSRIRALESATATQSDKLIIYRLITEKGFYDRLDERERQLYADYKGADRQALEEVEQAVNGNLHFPLERNTEPPTAADLQSIIDEVETEVKL